MQNARGGPVASKRRYDRRGHGGSPSPYSRGRAIKAPSLGKSGKTTDAVAHAKLRKSNRVVPPVTSLAKTLSFVADCADPELRAVYVTKAGGTKADVAAAIAAAEKLSKPLVTKSHLSTPPAPIATPAPQTSLPGSSSSSGSGNDPWQQKCEDYIAAHGRRGARMAGESWEDYFRYLVNG